MERRTASGAGLLTLLLCATGGWHELDAATHFLSPAEVVSLLTTPESRALGVEKASIDPELARLLVIEVGEEWFDLPQSRRIDLASGWLELWRHSVSRGVVSVLDASSGKPALSYGPRGRVNLLRRAPRENDSWS